MSDLGRVLVVLLAAANPAGVALAYAGAAAIPMAQRAARVIAAALIASSLVALLVLTRGGWLGYLQISPESFDVAAGLVLVIGAGQPLLLGSVAGRPSGGGADWSWRAAVAPLALPLLVGPPLLAAAVASAEHEGAAIVLGAAVLVIVATGALTVAARPVTAFARARLLAAFTRVTGALSIAIGLGMIVAGVRSV